jgi:hypothetical protein
MGGDSMALSQSDSPASKCEIGRSATEVADDLRAGSAGATARWASGTTGAYVLAGTNLGVRVNVTYKSKVAGNDPTVFAGAYPTLPDFTMAQATAALADGLGQAAVISNELISAASASAIQWTAAQTDVTNQLTALESSVRTAETESGVSLSSNNYAIQLAFNEATIANVQSLIGADTAGHGQRLGASGGVRGISTAWGMEPERGSFLGWIPHYCYSVGRGGRRGNRLGGQGSR